MRLKIFKKRQRGKTPKRQKVFGEYSKALKSPKKISKRLRKVFSLIATSESFN